LIIWALPGAEVQVLHQPTRASATCVAFGGSGQLLTAVCDSSAFVWDLDSGKQLYALKTGIYSRIALSPIHGWIAGAPLDKLIDVQTGRVLQELANGFAKASLNKMPRACAFSMDESIVALTDGQNLLAIHDTATGDLVHSIKMPRFAASVAISHDAKLVAAGSGGPSNGLLSFNRGMIRVCDVETGRAVHMEWNAVG
jgi:WD40 repeat protein